MRAMMILLMVMMPASGCTAGQSEHTLVYPGQAGPGAGKRIVLISGDEEYRSEQAMPMLARILSARHGFHCTVLFAIDPQRGIVQPNVQDNIPGLDALDQADLAIVFLRFRKLPDAQMQHIDRYLKAGKPVLGLRTSTHAFNMPPGQKWSHYRNGYRGEKQEWRDGFGRLVLGEKWIAHHGKHKSEGTRGLIPEDAADHPILRGIKNGDIWCDSDVYRVRLPLPGDSKPLVMGQVLDGMTPDAKPVEGEKNDPMMPVAWTKTYQLPGGKQGKAFTTTMGAATDLENAPLRRLIVNAAYWCVGLAEKIPADGTHVELVGPYNPDRYGFIQNEQWIERGLKPADLK